jgi:hypothetical protein
MVSLNHAMSDLAQSAKWTGVGAESVLAPMSDIGPRS